MIVGDGGCGKTSLLMVYSKGSFPEVRPPEGGGLEARRMGQGRARVPWGRGTALGLHPSLGPRSPASCAPRGGRPPGAPPREFRRLAVCVRGVAGGGTEPDGGKVEGGEPSAPRDPAALLGTNPAPSPTALRPIRVREVHGQRHGGQQGGDPEPLRHRR